MNRTHGVILGGLFAACCAFPAQAQPGPAGMGGGMGGMGPGSQATAVDCRKASNPQHCLDRQQAQTACKDLRGPARQDCMTDHMPPPDCDKSADPARCAAMQSARTACKGKYGPERQACLQENPVPLPSPGNRGGGMGPGMQGMGPGMGGMGGMGPCGGAGTAPCPLAPTPAKP